MVRVRGLEPPRLAATAPKAVVSTIPPYSHINGADGENRTPNLLITNQLPYHWATSA